jgi:hypothetical protein
MTRPTVRIHNAETNEIIDRPMTDDEFNQWEADKKAQAIKLQAEEARAAAKLAAEAKLAALGLDANDLRALGL